jgi:protein-S-isoprenylcysteine O-methyltransferase Ste14
MGNSPEDFLQLTYIGWFILLLYWIYAGMNTKITVKRERISSRLGYLALLLLAFELLYWRSGQMGFLGWSFLKNSAASRYIGLSINIAGVIFALVARYWLGKNWSAIVTIKKNHDLVQSGPYAITRNPIYTGLLFGFVGAVIIVGELRGLIALVILFISFEIKISKEEKFMNEKFPAYEAYALRTRKLIPFIY